MSLSPASGPNRLVKTENALAMLLLSLVWLIPNHQLPWAAFHHELAMGVAVVIFCLIIGSQTRWKAPVSGVALVVFSLALLPWFQWSTGLIPKFGTAFVSSTYVAAFALAIIIGHAGGLAKEQRLIHILFGALLVASVLNVVVQLVQWFQWRPERIDSLLMILVTPVKEGLRPSGMILQPNQLATLHVWALIALSWFRYNRSISKFLYVALFAYVCFGIGMTRSRTGLLEILLIALLMCWICWKESENRSIAFTWAVALVLLVIFEINYVDLAGWIGVGGETVQNRLVSGEVGTRIQGWSTFLAAAFERPWLGYGISDVGYAYVALAEKHPELYFGLRFAHAHNIVLDVILWVGIPMGLLLLGGFLVWLGRRTLALRSAPKTLFPLAILVTLGVHAMLELPHQFLYFLVPAGLCVGLLCSSYPTKPMWSLGRGSWYVFGTGATAVLIAIAHDYFPYQERYTEWRYENSRVGKRPDTPVGEPLVLNQIRDEIILYRVVLTPKLPLKELKWIEQTARSVNSPNAYYIAAKALALADRPTEATAWMKRFNAIMTRSEVEKIRFKWREDQLEYSSLAKLQWPEYLGR